jgi:hypothetical protein
MATPKTVKTYATAVIDCEPGNMEATGGLIGNWVVRYPDDTSLTASRAAIGESLRLHQVPRAGIEWTPAARKAHWAEFRKRYPRRKR